MDIAKLGVVIDPTRSTAGAAKVKSELKGIGQTAKTELGHLDQSAKKSGDALLKTGAAAKKAGSEARSGFLEMGRGVMDVLDGFGLLNNGFGSMLRRTDSAVRGGQQMAAAGRVAGAGMMEASGGAIQTAGALHQMSGASALANGRIASLIASCGGLGVVLGVVAAAFAVVLAGALAVGIAFKSLSAGVSEAAKMEQVMVRMAVAMGSFSKAREQFAVLRQFAADTPFSDEEVFAAGTALQAMTKGALTTRDALTAIGGAASQAGMGFQEMATNVGTIYNGLMNGTDTLEYMKTLVGKGIIDGATLAQVRQLGEEAEKSGSKTANAAKQWALVYADLESKGVALILQSQTWNGLLSTIEGNWQAIKASFGEQTMIALKPMLQDIIKLMPQIQAMAAAAGTAIGNGIGALYAAVQSGQLGLMLELGLKAAIEAAAAALVVIFQAQIIALLNFLTTIWSGTITLITTIFSTGFSAVVGVITSLIQGDFSGAIGKVGTFFQNLFAGGGGGGGGIVANIGKAIYNAVASALVKAVNAFIQAFYKAWQAVSNSIAAAKAQFGVDTTSLGPVIPKPFTFTPMKIEFKDLTRAANDLVGTENRDNLMGKINELAPKNEDPNVELPQPMVPPPALMTGGGAGGGGGGKSAAVVAPPKAEVVKSQMAELMTAWADLGKQMDQTFASAAESVATNMSGAMQSMIMGTKDAKTAFSDMATGIIGDITSMILKMTIQLAISKALGPYGAAFQGVAAGIAHTGGTVGQTNLSQVPKFHQGGRLSSESLIRADKGETILTRRRSAELGRELAQSRQTRQSAGEGKQGGNATIINVLDRNEIADAIAKSPGAVVNAMSRNLPAVRKMVMTGNRA